MPYADPLTDDELSAALAGLSEWTSDGVFLRRSVQVSGFTAAADLVRAVADAANAADHHPDVHITGYRNVAFELTTHATGAITRRDTALAAEIDRIVARIGGE
jgi:4a-hydroxytetrahydrobiopterin dehydratase